METPVYLLIRRTPFMAVTAHTTSFATVERAGRAAGLVLYDNAMVPRTTAQKHGDKIAMRPLGSVYEHDSGYSFRILRADHTADGIPITPGLRVLNNDLKWGSVCRAQFMSEGMMSPGGECFIGWYDVDVDGYGRSPFNGERLTTDGSFFDKPDTPLDQALASSLVLDNPPTVRTDGSPG